MTTRKKDTKLTFVEWILFCLVMLSLFYTLAVDFEGEHNEDLIRDIASRVRHLESETPCDTHSYYYDSHTAFENVTDFLDIPESDEDLADALSEQSPLKEGELLMVCPGIEKNVNGNVTCKTHFNDGDLELVIRHEGDLLLWLSFQDECKWRKEAGLSLESDVL